MASFRKTSVIILFFFLGFALSKTLKLGYSQAFQLTNDDDCESCVGNCVRALFYDIKVKCEWEDRPCVCRGIWKGIDCMEACPDCEIKYDSVRGYKKAYAQMCPI